MKQYVKSNPFFYRLILSAMFICCILILVLAWFIPAPLQEQGTIAIVPNPVKSAWFLLWIQEIVGYDKRFIYVVAFLALVFISLPWLSRYRCDHAYWLSRKNLLAGWGSLLAFFIIIFLTVVAMFFRGENWAFVMPF